MASEVGVYDVDPADVIHKVSHTLVKDGLFSKTFFFQGRLEPSRMLLIDTANRVIIGDDEIKMSIARSRPHAEWLAQLVTLDDIRKTSVVISNQNGPKPSIEPQLKSAEEIRKILSLFNYTLETLSLLLVPMFTNK